jgi:hypothetical protein
MPIKIQIKMPVGTLQSITSPAAAPTAARMRFLPDLASTAAFEVVLAGGEEVTVIRFVTGGLAEDVSKTSAEVTKLGAADPLASTPSVVVVSVKPFEEVGEAIGTKVDAGDGILESVKMLPVGTVPVGVNVAVESKPSVYEAVPV